jgi:hypothetical protein
LKLSRSSFDIGPIPTPPPEPYWNTVSVSHMMLIPKPRPKPLLMPGAEYSSANATPTSSFTLAAARSAPDVIAPFATADCCFASTANMLLSRSDSPS